MRFLSGNPMVTVHILTKNNAQTIHRALDSVRWADSILIADLGSTDRTIPICEEAGATVFRMDCPRNDARNTLIAKSEGVVLCLEPWEAVAQGHRTIPTVTEQTYVTVLTHKTIAKEIRLWNGPAEFINPVYERIDGEGRESDVLLYSTGRNDYADLIPHIRKWQSTHPMAAAPYYYEACTLLAMGHWRQFITISEHYMFLDKTQSISAVMNRYYYAMVQLMNVRKVKPTLQNLSLCLAAKPLMAEFWCLAGDVHYHLTKKFQTAIDLYENAMLLGSRRLKGDHWPMDLTKYKTYPQAMIQSCRKLMEHKSFYLPNRL